MSREYHALRDSPEYGIWNSMKDRCSNPNNPYYHRYGGRGIAVCERWTNSFTAFYEDMGPRPSAEYSIERGDNDGNYEPGNCRWATAGEQAQNRSTNHMVEHDGKTITRKEFSTKTGLNYTTIGGRMNRSGMTFEDAVAMVPYGAKLYEHNGESLTLRQWAVRLNTDYFRLYNAIVRNGKTIGEVIDKTKT